MLSLGVDGAALFRCRCGLCLCCYLDHRGDHRRGVPPVRRVHHMSAHGQGSAGQPAPDQTRGTHTHPWMDGWIHRLIDRDLLDDGDDDVIGAYGRESR